LLQHLKQEEIAAWRKRTRLGNLLDGDNRY
jgi:hypothetical protein